MLLVGLALDFACQAPSVYATITCDAATVTQSTSNRLDHCILNACLAIVFSTARLLVHTRRAIEEFDLSEGAARLFGLVAERESASISTRKDSVHIRSNQRVNRSAGHLLNLFGRFEKKQFNAVLVICEHERVNGSPDAS